MWNKIRRLKLFIIYTKPPTLNPTCGRGTNQGSRRTGAEIRGEVLCTPVLGSTQSDWTRRYQHNEGRSHFLQVGCKTLIVFTRSSLHIHVLATSLLKVQYAAPNLSSNLSEEAANSRNSARGSRDAVKHLLSWNTNLLRRFGTAVSLNMACHLPCSLIELYRRFRGPLASIRNNPQDNHLLPLHTEKSGVLLITEFQVELWLPNTLVVAHHSLASSIYFSSLSLVCTACKTTFPIHTISKSSEVMTYDIFLQYVILHYNLATTSIGVCRGTRCRCWSLEEGSNEERCVGGWGGQESDLMSRVQDLRDLEAQSPTPNPVAIGRFKWGVGGRSSEDAASTIFCTKKVLLHVTLPIVRFEKLIQVDNLI